jgi:hypothetical protein
VQAFLASNDATLFWALGGFFALGLGTIIASASSSFGTPKRVDKRWVIIKSGGKPFRDSLPQSPIPQF